MIKYNLTIKEMPEYERPREKLIRYGSETLSNSELLAILIRTWLKGTISFRTCKYSFKL